VRGDRQPHRGWPGWLALGAVGALFVAELAVIWSTAVDLPYWDEWELLEPGTALGSGLSFEWLMGRSNEHRLPMTKLLVWLQYQLDGWNVATGQAIAFAIYGAAVATAGWSCRRWAPRLPGWLLGLACCAPLSPLGWESHAMAYPSEFPLFLLAFLVTIACLFTREQRRWQIGLGIAAGWLTLGFAGGVAGLLAVGLVYARFKRARARTPDAAPARRHREMVELTLVLATFAVGVAMWLSGYPPDWPNLDDRGELPALVWPWTPAFWSHFLRLVSFGFGVTVGSIAVGIVCLASVVAPLIVLGRRPRTDHEACGTVAALLGLLAVLATISLGRAGLGAEQAGASRYFILASLLVPFGLAAWSQSLAGRAHLVALSAIGVVLAASFADDWQLAPYRQARRERARALECVRDYYADQGDGWCPGANPAMPLGRLLDNARRLDVSFTRGLGVRSRSRPP
jgi:hypothetical protein